MNSQSIETNIFMQNFIAPIVTGLAIGGIMFFLQYVYKPLMDKTSLIKKEQWLTKKEAFTIALELIDKHYYANDLRDEKGRLIHKKEGDEPTPEEINRCLIKLILLSDTDQIILKFKDFFIKPFTFTQRGEFIFLIRKELFSSKSGIKAEEVPIFLKKEDNELNK